MTPEDVVHYIAIGQSLPDREYLCVNISNEDVGNIIRGGSTYYAVVTCYKFKCPKKVVYSVIMANINRVISLSTDNLCGFVPGAIPEFFPNKYFNQICDVIRLSIAGLTIGPDLKPLYQIKQIGFETILQKYKSQIEINLNTPSFIILDKKTCVVHKLQ